MGAPFKLAYFRSSGESSCFFSAESSFLTGGRTCLAAALYAGVCLLSGGILSHHPVLRLCSRGRLLSLSCSLRVSWALLGRSAPLCTMGSPLQGSFAVEGRLWEAALETHRQEMAVTQTTTGEVPWSHSTCPSPAGDLRQGLPRCLFRLYPSICFLSCSSVLKSSGL